MTEKHQAYKPSVTIVKITGANQKMVEELKTLVVTAGYEIVMNSKHKPRVRFHQDTNLWTCYVCVHESEAPKIDEALMTVEGI